MNRVVSILMKRDGITESEAKELVEEVRAEITQGVEDGIYTYDDVECILASDLGLEMDYLVDIL